MKLDHHYTLEGHTPVKVTDLFTWAEWFETADRTVARTKIQDIEISTVFLGLDHGFLSKDPILFETMIFGGQHDQDMWRYSTWDQAEQGHAVTVKLVKRSLIKIVNGNQ